MTKLQILNAVRNKFSSRKGAKVLVAVIGNDIQITIVEKSGFSSVGWEVSTTRGTTDEEYIFISNQSWGIGKFATLEEATRVAKALVNARWA